MSEPNLRLLVRALREREDAKAKRICHECGRKLPKKKPEPREDKQS